MVRRLWIPVCRILHAIQPLELLCTFVFPIPTFGFCLLLEFPLLLPVVESCFCWFLPLHKVFADVFDLLLIVCVHIVHPLL